jgi:hypothetical protein
MGQAFQQELLSRKYKLWHHTDLLKQIKADVQNTRLQ